MNLIAALVDLKASELKTKEGVWGGGQWSQLCMNWDKGTGWVSKWKEEMGNWTWGLELRREIRAKHSDLERISSGLAVRPLMWTTSALKREAEKGTRPALEEVAAFKEWTEESARQGDYTRDVRKLQGRSGPKAKSTLRGCHQQCQLFLEIRCLLNLRKRMVLVTILCNGGI